ncbi:MAG: hypothetical protein ACRCW2_10005 [Cellulosilyticaceae bacterium]
MKVSIAVSQDTYRTDTLQYAVDELSYFLNQTQVHMDEGIRLTIDTKIQAYSCTISQDEQGVSIAASCDADVLWGVYRLLGEVGFYFDAHGVQVIPGHIDTEKIRACFRTYTPHVLKRGIRQHINFPMDISSYPLEEALDYIRNLARCGFNHITFHSYPEQWYTYAYKEKTTYAGKFFYGEKHPVPQCSVITPYIRNKEMYMIPELEAIKDMEIELAQKAINWLQKVMAQAKQCGMSIQFSCEPRGACEEETFAMLQQIYESYPLIDTLELITEECGGYKGVAYTAGEVEETINRLFGESALKRCKPYIQDHLSQLPGPLDELARHLQVIALGKEAGFPVEMSLGLYITELKSLVICLEILKACAPEDVAFACLSAHGAGAVAQNLEGMPFTASDLTRTMPYSWVEFDGSMYEQQSAIEGLTQCMEVLQEKMGEGQAIPALVVNHWRTAENIVTLNYFAYACQQGVDQEAFFKDYCMRYGIKAPKKVQDAFSKLERASETVRYHLGNSGFCYLGCWFNSGLGLIGCWSFDNVNKALYDYNTALTQFKQLGDTGCKDIALMINRIECSILHLTALKTLIELQKYCNHKASEELSSEEKLQIRQICDNAQIYIDEYMKHHCECMPDRGCEGTIISYEHVLNGAIAYIHHHYLGSDRQSVHTGNDAPPPPAI